MKKTSLENSLRLTWQWFRKSGVMIPEDGTWGVAERVLLLNHNEALEKIKRGFPAWTPHKDYFILESRRADCCMETAFLFFLLHKIFGNTEPFRQTAENILDFLYYRSGLLNRFSDKDETLVGTWDWSHIKRVHNIYYDDDSWMITLALKISRRYPALDRKYEMKKFALLLADTLAADALNDLNGNKREKREFNWLGDLRLPHWGSLVSMALAEAYREIPKKMYLDFITAYEKFLMGSQNTFTTSEFGYALIGATSAYRATKRKSSLACAKTFADKILNVMDPETGCIPSEHYEAPSGKKLADTIYTMNWALLGLQNMKKLDPKYAGACDKILALLLAIQDHDKKTHLHGCWRGMYDMEHGRWDGGDKFEGGANSIYTGWTNAPIAWACAFELLDKSLMNV